MKNLKLLFILFTFSICITSCSDDDSEESSDFDGSINSIENFYTPELLDTLNELGFIINTGNTPPITDGTYLANPLILSNSNIPNDNIGSIFNDFLMTIANQNNENLTLDFEALDGDTVIQSIQSFVSGSDDDFSIFLKVESTGNNNTSLLAYAISGTLSTEGILNYQLALIMLDDNGDPNDNLIENNTGRLFVDGNDLCDLIPLDSNSRISYILKNNMPNTSKSF